MAKKYKNADIKDYKLVEKKNTCLKADCNNPPNGFTRLCGPHYNDMWMQIISK